MEVSDDHVTVAGVATIHAPYTADQCVCANELVLQRLDALLRRIPPLGEGDPAGGADGDQPVLVTARAHLAGEQRWRAGAVICWEIAVVFQCDLIFSNIPMVLGICSVRLLISYSSLCGIRKSL